MTSVHAPKDIVIQDLHAELDPGRAKSPALRRPYSVEAVRAGLDGHADAAVGRVLVPGVSFLQ
jgi:hypothetical protein